MEDLLIKLTQNKKGLDDLRPLPPELINNLDDWFKVELTYTSNAIEGNTLSRAETALIVEKGITVEGKSLKEHLEAVNHAEALEFIKTLAGKKRQKLTEETILRIHSLILSKIDETNAGRYRTVSVRIAGVPVVMPNPLKVPDLMAEFYEWLHKKNKDHPAKIGADAHLKFVSIHPFVDGNGRTARLLLNLILMQNGYPPALIRKEDRRTYLDSIAKAQLQGDLNNYYQVIYKSINRAYEIYFKAVKPTTGGGNMLIPGKKQLFKIGELAKAVNETVPTIRHWSQIGILDVADHTPKGYQLYDRSMIDRIYEIRKLQKEKYLPLSEINKIIRAESNNNS